MKLTVHTFTTLDGVMQSPGAPDEDRAGGFTHGGWMAPFAADPQFGAIVEQWFTRAEQFLLGRTTYEAMAGFWPQISDPENSVGHQLNNLPKHVVSTTLTRPDWQHTTIIEGQVERSIRALKDRDGGELQVHGSWQLVRSLHQLNLVDEYRMLVFPVVLGQGKRLFHDGVRPTSLEVVESRTTDLGATYLCLRPTTAPTHGEFVVDDGNEATLLP
jgi:dihydrofolate reductase